MSRGYLSSGQRSRLVVVVVLAMCGWWLATALSTDSSQLQQRLLGATTGPAPETIMVWVERPATQLTLIERQLGVPLGELMLPAGTERLLSRAREVLLLAEEGAVLKAEVRLGSVASIVTKALGIVRKDAWLRGGTVSIGGNPARVRWGKGGSFVADRWILERYGAAGAPLSPASLPRGEEVEVGMVALVRVPAPGSESSVWGLVPQTEEDSGLHWQRLGGSVEGQIALPWWTTNGDPRVLDGLSSDAVLAAAARTGDDWQVMLWNDSPIEIDEFSVSLEVPRAGLLASVGHPTPWTLPAEGAARSLAASIDELSPSATSSLRSLSAEVTLVLSSRTAQLEHWTMGLREGAIAAQVDPAALVVWLEAVVQMGRTLPGAQLGDGARALRRDGAAGPLLSRLPRLQLHLQQDDLWVRAHDH